MRYKDDIYLERGWEFFNEAEQEEMADEDGLELGNAEKKHFNENPLDDEK